MPGAHRLSTAASVTLAQLYGDDTDSVPVPLQRPVPDPLTAPSAPRQAEGPEELGSVGAPWPPRPLALWPPRATVTWRTLS